MFETIGIISDTHGLVRPKAHDALKGSKLIIHAGDIGKSEVMEELSTIAPLIADRGNVDKGVWADALPTSEMIEFRGRYFYILHNLDELDLDPVAAGVDVVVFGHSHKPRNEVIDGVLYFNPGSAGPRRFKLPIGIGKIHLNKDGSMNTEWIDLEPMVHSNSVSGSEFGCIRRTTLRDSRN